MHFSSVALEITFEVIQPGIYLINWVSNYTIVANGSTEFDYSLYVNSSPLGPFQNTISSGVTGVSISGTKQAVLAAGDTVYLGISLFGAGTPLSNPVRNSTINFTLIAPISADCP